MSNYATLDLLESCHNSPIWKKKLKKFVRSATEKFRKLKIMKKGNRENSNSKTASAKCCSMLERREQKKNRNVSSLRQSLLDGTGRLKLFFLIITTIKLPMYGVLDAFLLRWLPVQHLISERRHISTKEESCSKEIVVILSHQPEIISKMRVS